MVIAHNMAAMLAAEHGNKSSGAASRALKRLSSGRYINSAADNAAGLGVSQKMRSQINGMNRAVSNCQEGISLFQTLEKALKEANAMIERCKILASQSASGTYCDDVDREAMEQEYEQLLEEIDQISDTDFNGVCMLNGGEMHSSSRNAGDYLLDWESGTVVNMTNYPDFTMNIKPLPAFEEYMDSTDEKIAAAMESFNNSEIGVDTANGRNTFYFKGDAPEGLSIETKGAKGIVYFNKGSELVPIAEVTARSTGAEFSSTGAGTWSNPTSQMIVEPPKSISTSGAVLNYPSKNSDEYDNDPNTNRNQALRTEYHDWIQSIPTNTKVTFKVSDDRKHFTIEGDASYFSLADGTPCGNTTEYDINTVLTMTTDNSKCNTSGVSYRWDDAKITVKWDPDRIKTGSDIYMSVTDCLSKSAYSYTYEGALPDKNGGKTSPYYYLEATSKNPVF